MISSSSLKKINEIFQFCFWVVNSKFSNALKYEILSRTRQSKRISEFDNLRRNFRRYLSTKSNSCRLTEILSFNRSMLARWRILPEELVDKWWLIFRNVGTTSWSLQRSRKELGSWRLLTWNVSICLPCYIKRQDQKLTSANLVGYYRFCRFNWSLNIFLHILLLDPQSFPVPLIFCSRDFRSEYISCFFNVFPVFEKPRSLPCEQFFDKLFPLLTNLV